MFSHSLPPLQRHNRDSKRKKREWGRERAEAQEGETESRQRARERRSVEVESEREVEVERGRAGESRREREKLWEGLGGRRASTHNQKCFFDYTHTGPVKQDTNNY